jgi:hypothetical protein
MTGMLFRPLNSAWKMQRKTEGGESISDLAESFIKPNNRLTSFERLEIYNRCYWFRVLDSLYDDFPGLLAILGNRKFLKLATAYLIQYPSESFTLRNLGSRLEQFLTEEPDWIAPHNEVALDMLRFEWAQIVAFDGPARKPITPRELQKQTPATLRLGLQPYLSLLALDHAVDQYFIAVKNQETDGLRSEASNTSDTAPDQSRRKKRLRLPKPEKIHLAVHRHDNMLYTKRLEPAAFALLTALRQGATLEAACETAIAADTSKVRKAKAGHDFPQRLTEWFADWSSLGWFTQPDSKTTPSKTSL